MELFQIVENFQPLVDERLLRRAEELTPKLLYTEVAPVSVEVRSGESKTACALSEMPAQGLGANDSIVFDFGNHFVGHVSFRFGFKGSHPDAPAYFRLRFAEIPKEFTEDVSAYKGWISRGWIQEELVHIDELPATLALPRRYAFRYLELTVIDTSRKFRMTVEDVKLVAETSVDLSSIDVQPTGDAMLDRIEAVSLRTLANCMQTVFEDGPKRDRRLWMGDLRLQALANYVSFKNYDLVKRCLYLFGGSRFPDGRVSACLFTSPSVEADDTYFVDYSLLYPVVLEEYLAETNDAEALSDLYDIAIQQIRIPWAQCENGLLPYSAAGSTFVDWCAGLDKHAAAQAILIYTAKYARRLAERKGDDSVIAEMDNIIEKATAAARSFWDAEENCFVSGPERQRSLASQIWMVLAGVATQAEAQALLADRSRYDARYALETPYMNHYYVAALLESGLKEQAHAEMKAYWGSMIERDADTFWETWNPARPDASPYGGTIVNSYCHAWSCTPVWLLRNYF